ncbi:MAG: hypothetical protein LH478_07345 [Chitinophagaceae bacterium]|nr:hypothetical protein [Chitinophagaceae bacterium]
MRIFALLLFFISASVRAQHTVDVLIKNGRIIDGTGNPWYRGDIAIKDG